MVTGLHTIWAGRAGSAEKPFLCGDEQLQGDAELHAIVGYGLVKE